jgi:hypothetical protein
LPSVSRRELASTFRRARVALMRNLIYQELSSDDELHRVLVRVGWHAFPMHHGWEVRAGLSEVVRMLPEEGEQ